MKAFDFLLNQIDVFIKKYYKNLLIKGGLLFVLIFVISFVLVSVLEFYGRLSTPVRAFLFYAFLLANSYVLVKYIIDPLLKLYKIGKHLSHDQAALYIGNFFPEIADKLKNTLDLKNSLSDNENELLLAAIEQRTKQLTVFKFDDAISYQQNKRYLKYVLPLFAIVILLAVVSPSLFQDGFTRVVSYNTYFKPKAPFDFILQSNDLGIEEGEDFEVRVKLTGSALPSNLFLVSENGKVLMEQVGKTSYKAIIKRPSKGSRFYFIGNEFESDVYTLDVFGKAFIGKFEALISYPSYLQRKPTLVSNPTAISVPEGSKISFKGLVQNVKGFDIFLNDKKQSFNDHQLNYQHVFYESSDLKFVLDNPHKIINEVYNSKVEIIKDAYPTIDVVESSDSLKDGVRYFSGVISDDNGLRDVYFVYTIQSKNGKSQTKKLLVNKFQGVDGKFDFAVDLRRESIQLEDKIEYYFQVADNDEIHHYKKSQSQHFTYEVPSLDELLDERKDQLDNSKDKLKDLLNKSKDFQKKLKNLKSANANKSNQWNKVNKVQELKQEQQDLMNQLNTMQQELKESQSQKNQLSPMDQEVFDKQALIEEMMKDLMDQELMDLLNELEELYKKNDQEGANDKLNESQENAEDLNKQLDRTLEMLKKMELNEKIDDIEKKLEDLKSKQEDLSKQIQNKTIDSEKALPKQEEINNSFKELEKDLQDMHDLNEKLEDKMELSDTKENEKDISDDLQNASENLKDNKSKNAQSKQKSAAEKMDQLKQKLQDEQQRSNQKEAEEDIESLRAILEGLMTLSFDQEKLMSQFTALTNNDPSYKKYGRRQRRIIEDTKSINDSLESLAKRQPKIASIVKEELKALNRNLEQSIEAIDEHKKRELALYQQYAMTSYNNLALLLNESLQQMQQQMQQKGKQAGSGSCSKPGGMGQGKPGKMNTGDMKEMLKKQLESMKKGPNPGGKKPGDKPGDKPGQGQGGGQGMLGLQNKEIAKMAAEQTAMRRRLEELRNELNKDGKGSGNKLNPLINELEKQERDIINKRFTQETLKRQQEILTRLLESEKAINERGFEEKRESNSAKNENFGNLILINQYNEERLKQMELLRNVDPMFFKYYRDKANTFFNLNY
jgi:hypothetical protein